jgi:hypothetical protein
MSTIAIDGQSLDVQELAADHQTLEISAEVDRDDISTWRQYDRPGEATTTIGANGEFRTTDRSGGGQPVVTVEPPDEWQPEPLDAHDAIITDYSETEVAPDRYELELTLTRTSNRDRTVSFPNITGFGRQFGRYFGTSEPSERIGKWVFKLSRGKIGLDSGQVLLEEFNGSSVGGSWTLPLLVDDLQARVVMESLSHIDAVAERNIPDATDRLVDTTSGSWNQISIRQPVNGQLFGAATEAIATGWEMEWYSHRHWRIDLSLTVIGGSGTN